MNHLAFKKFLASTGLSTRRFGDQCGIGKTTVHRLAQPLHGGLTAPYVSRITPIVMDACRRQLESAGAGAGTIHRLLTEIFGDEFKPMINHRVTLTPEVLEFFQLARDPFAAPRSPAELFTTPAIESVYAQLCTAVRCQGFVCLLAPVGAGKTMLKNRLIAGLKAPLLGKGGVAAASADGVVRSDPRSDDNRTSPHVSKGESLTAPNEIQNPKSKIQDPPGSPPYKGGVAEGRGGSPMNAQRSKDLGLWTLDLGPASIIISPRFADMSRVTAAGIVAYVLEELGVKPRRALVLAQKQLEQRLAELAQNNITVALCFDECHHLNDTLLTALKNFYELGAGGFERYLGLILFGQPQFAARLSEPRFREIAERLACLELPAFSASTAENYLAHCLNNARHTTRQSPGSNVQCPKSKSSPPARGGVAAAPADGVVGEANSDLGPWTLDLGPSSNPKSLSSPPYEGGVAGVSPDGVVLSSNPNSANSLNSPNTLNLFAPEALRLIAARASTPLGIANAASAAMIEAYKKGERCVLARFVSEGTGPKAMKVGR